MRIEKRRLTILFATFVVAYFLRFIYQLILGHRIYREWVQTLWVRWFIINILPLVWDITSILSILIMHYMSFREKPVIKIIPRAGHFKEQSGLPEFSDTDPTLRDTNSTSGKTSFVQLLDAAPTNSPSQLSKRSNKGGIMSPHRSPRLQSEIGYASFKSKYTPSDRPKTSLTSSINCESYDDVRASQIDVG